MIRLFGGGGGLPPGVTGNGLMPGGLTVAGAVGVNGGTTGPTAPFAVGEPGSGSFITTTTGDGSTVPSFFTVNGQILAQDTPAVIVDGDDQIEAQQGSPLTNNYSGACLRAARYGALNGFDYTQSMIMVTDQTASTQPLVACTKQGVRVFQVPAAVQYITGALSTVTDPAAKAVLTSIISLLVTGFSMGTNGTT